MLSFSQRLFLAFEVLRGRLAPRDLVSTKQPLTGVVAEAAAPAEGSSVEPNAEIVDNVIPLPQPAVAEVAAVEEAPVVAAAPVQEELLATVTEIKQAVSRVSSIDWNSLFRNAHDGGANSVLASHVLKKTMSLLDTGNGQVEKMLKEVNHVSQDTLTLRSVSSSIYELSKKTSMVSLNLMIEAARLGDQGRSIDIVAVEMKKLAEDFKSMTSQVEEKIGAVSQQTKNSESTCKQVSQLFFVVKAELEQFRILMSRIEELASTQTEKLRNLEKEAA